jgi:hypothetical protein
MSSQELLFPEPSDPNICIWHYMDFAKFVSMLQHGGLYFPTVARLQEDDPLEGTLPYKLSLAAEKSAEETAIARYRSDPKLTGVIDRLGDKGFREIAVAFWQLGLLGSLPKRNWWAVEHA